jgi:hypothetical protein
MMKTIPMRAYAPRHPHAIPTRNLARTVSRAVGALVAAFCAALLCIGLVGYGIARAGAPARLPAAAAAVTAQAAPLGHEAAELKAAVQALPAFPDPYPAAAGVSP